MYRRVVGGPCWGSDGRGNFPYYWIVTETEGGDLCIGTILADLQRPRYYFNIGAGSGERPIDIIHDRLCPARNGAGRCTIRTASTVDAAQQAIIAHYEAVMDAYVREALTG